MLHPDVAARLHQVPLQALQRPVDEVHPTILFRGELVEDVGVEDEEGQHIPMLVQRSVQPVIVVQSKVASEPVDGDAGFLHARFFERCSSTIGQQMCSQAVKRSGCAVISSRSASSST